MFNRLPLWPYLEPESEPIPSQSPREQGLEGGLLLDQAVAGEPRRGLAPDSELAPYDQRWARDL